MKRNTALVLAMGLFVGAMHSSAAEAGSQRHTKKLSPDRTEMPAEFREAHRFDRDPSMQFCTGLLSRDGLSGWRVGDYRLQLSSSTVVIGPDGLPAVLEEGAVIIAMGPRFGDTFLGWNVRVLEANVPPVVKRAEVVKKPSDSNPDVGELVSSPY